MYIAALKDQVKVVNLLLDLGAAVDMPNEASIITTEKPGKIDLQGRGAQMHGLAVRRRTAKSALWPAAAAAARCCCRVLAFSGSAWILLNWCVLIGYSFLAEQGRQDHPACVSCFTLNMTNDWS